MRKHWLTRPTVLRPSGETAGYEEAVLRAENASPRNTAANTKNTTPMPDESRVKSTMAMMKNNSPARALPNACLDMTSPYRRKPPRKLGGHSGTVSVWVVPSGAFVRLTLGALCS